MIDHLSNDLMYINNVNKFEYNQVECLFSS